MALFSAPMCFCGQRRRTRHNANYVAYAQMPGCPLCSIRDQVIEKGSSTHLRRKFLDKSGNIALNEMQRIARAFEAVDLQMRSMEQEGNQERPNDDKEEVNAVDSKLNWKGKSGDIG